MLGESLSVQQQPWLLLILRHQISQPKPGPVLSKEAADCTCKAERQRRNRGTGVRSDPVKASERIRHKERNYFPPAHLYHCINVPFAELFTFPTPHG